MEIQNTYLNQQMVSLNGEIEKVLEEIDRFGWHRMVAMSPRMAMPKMEMDVYSLLSTGDAPAPLLLQQVLGALKIARHEVALNQNQVLDDIDSDDHCWEEKPEEQSDDREYH